MDKYVDPKLCYTPAVPLECVSCGMIVRLAVGARPSPGGMVICGRCGEFQVFGPQGDTLWPMESSSVGQLREELREAVLREGL